MRAFTQSILDTLGRAARSDLARNAARDLKSLRALWNWVYMALYVWMCVWAVLYHPETIPTAITVTGGVVSVIFTGYVCTRTFEKVKNGHSHQPVGRGDEDGAGD